jgi:hypothetical protein
MFDLFRFVMLRPAIPRGPDEVISTAGESSLQRKLEHDRGGPSPGTQMSKTANEFLGSDRFVADAKSLAFGEAYERLIDTITAKPPADLNELSQAITNSFTRPLSDLATSSNFTEDRKRLADSLIAAKLGDPPFGAPLYLLARNLRLIVLIERAAAGDSRLDAPRAIEAALAASIALTEGLLPLPPPAQSPAGGGEQPRGNEREQREEMRRQYRELSEAHSFLSELQPQHIADLESVPSSPSTTPSESTPDISEALFRELRELRQAVSARGIASERLEGGVLTTAAHVVAGANFILKREVLEQATAGVRSGLHAAGIDLITTPVPVAIERINAKLTELTPFVADDTFSRSNVSMVGGQFFPTNALPDLNAVGGRRNHE